jgi:hypothetical protein
VVNDSPSREIEISHIWFDLDDGRQLHLVNDPHRPLPARLRLDEAYETWMPVTQAGGVLDWAGRFKVKLSAGPVFASRLNKSIPAMGAVAGGGESPYAARHAIVSICLRRGDRHPIQGGTGVATFFLARVC